MTKVTRYSCFLLLFLLPVIAAPMLRGAEPFNPKISFILDVSYARRNITDEVFQGLEIPGFLHGDSHGHGDGHAHAPAGADNGFNLNYGELVLAAAVDPYFDLFTSFHLTEDAFEIEEAYVETRRLPLNLRVKAGKFRSGFGRLNSRHAHLWDFNSIPLVYRVFFGDEGLAEKGMQLNWIAPLDFYLALGVETLQGVNERSFGTEAFHVDTEEGEIETDAPPLPNLWTVFAKTSFDAGDLTVLAGASFAVGESRFNGLEEAHEPGAFTGDTRLFGLDLTARWVLDSYRHLALEIEYIARRRKGTWYGAHDDGETHEDETHEDEGHEHEDEEPGAMEAAQLDKKQAGLYAQLVFRFHKLWRVGARLDLLNKNDVRLDGVREDLPQNLKRYGFMVDYSPTEFSRVRLQYDINRFAWYDEKAKHFHRVTLQLNVAVGAHGSHTF